MPRTSKSGAPADGAIDNLDTLDIDDMFADDGDALFDGLDLDLEPMGDIADMGNAAEAAAPTEPVKEEKAEPAPAPVPAADEPPKRRKTKRKLKATVLAGEEEDEAPTKKKRRAAKPGTTKKKTSKKEEVKAEVVVKAKSKTKITTPLPIARAASSSGPTSAIMTQGNVAAAGQFGGRQKRGQFALPLSRSKSDSQQKAKSKLAISKPPPSVLVSSASSTSLGEKKKNKKTSTTTATTTATTTQSTPVAPVPLVPEKPAPFAPPHPQATFCGLSASSGLFYPFMPALPPEPSLKNRKQYPVIDKIHASFSSYINATNVPKGNNNDTTVAETENIFQLMMDTLKDQIPAGGQTQSADFKKTAMSNAIYSLRKMVAGMEKGKLALDLFSVAALLKRQHDFLNQNLQNMDKWCKSNFTEQEYAATYGLSDPQKKQKETVAVESVFAGLKAPLVKVKIKFSGFKESKLNPPLFAILPKSVISGSSSAPEHSKEKKTTKKRKSSILDPSTVTNAVAVPTADKEDLWKTYMTQRPGKRRQLVADDVALTAKELEAACISSTIARCQAIERRHADLKSTVEKDDAPLIHTATMWQYIDKAGYFSAFTDESLKDTLRSVWSPEVKYSFQREITRSSTPKVVRAKREGQKSVFEGLQSLLVEVMSDDEGDSDDDDDSILDNDDNVDAVLDPSIQYNTKLVDLSGLTLDERAFTHLCKAGLLDEDACFSDFSEGGKPTTNADVNGDSSLEDVIQRMSDDLLRLSSANNARSSFLEAVAGAFNTRTKAKSQRAVEEAATLAKYQQLLKRRNDIKLKAALMPKSKDEYALPW